jgi:hypothetical protein
MLAGTILAISVSLTKSQVVTIKGKGIPERQQRQSWPFLRAT